jgi:UDP-galactopyranose mutase
MTAPDLVCLSHLRWNFVFQRPQHLMVRFARERRVFFVEEPVFDAAEPRLDAQTDIVHVVTPHLPPGLRPSLVQRVLQRLLRSFCRSWQIDRPLVWCYTPMAWPLMEDIPASAVVYDCMDELSGFAGASPELRARERDLIARADVMFTGGHSLYEAKRALHPNVHPFPSSVDVAHFGRARAWAGDPADQQAIGRPRIGFCGVIDERMNRDLVREVAAARPDWHFVMIGPIVKIDESGVPRGANLHYLGMKSYEDLPAYLGGWDVAMLPFAHNAATRFISPTKTPEYLAAGCPVVSTSIRDVVRPYGERGLVSIADTPAEFIDAIARTLAPGGRDCLARADALLATQSWDLTWAAMNDLILEAESSRPSARPRPAAAGADVAQL